MDNILHTAKHATYFELIPLEPHGKRPILDEWQKPEARAAFPWFLHDGNVGGVIGPENLVLDIDPRNGGAESFKKLCDTFPGFAGDYQASVYTAGQGAHFYFRLPEAHGLRIKKSLKDYPGLDWLSGNKYVVLPGSTNGTGSWRWADGPVSSLQGFPLQMLEALFPPDTPSDYLPDAEGLWGILMPGDLKKLLAVLDVTDFQEHEAWLELMMACHNATGGQAMHEFVEWCISDPAYSDRGQDIEYRWETLTAQGPGERPITARSLTRYFDTAPQWLISRLKMQDPATLFKPLDAVSTQNRSAELRMAVKEHATAISAEDDLIDLELVVWPAIAMDSRLSEGQRSLLAKKISKKSGIPRKDLEAQVAKKEKQEEDTINEDEIQLSVAEGVIRRLGGRDKLVKQTGDLWEYNGKHWEMLNNENIRYEITETAIFMGGGGYVTGPFISSVDTVTMSRFKALQEGYWNPEKEGVWINCADYALELQEDGRWRQHPHHKAHRMNYALTISPRDIPTPRFDSFMASALDSDEGTIRTLLAAMIYTVTSKKQWLKKCFFLHGDTNSGKSVFLEIVEAMIPEKQRSALAMKDISKQFLLEQLRGKLMNSAGEISKQHIDTENFKKLTSGDTQTADRKNRGSVTFKNNAILWFAGNNWPSLQDSSSASIGRIALVEFPYTIESEDKDFSLVDDIVANELPGVFFKALKIFAEEYLKDECRTVCDTPDKSMRALKMFKYSQQPIRIWVDENLRITKNEEDFSGSKAMYQDYSMWAQSTGHKVMSESSFQSRLPKVTGRNSSRGPGRNSSRGYYGMLLENKFEKLEHTS